MEDAIPGEIGGRILFQRIISVKRMNQTKQTRTDKSVETIKKYFPEAMEEEWFQRKSIERLTQIHQFDFDRMIVATSVCSDEINRSMTDPEYPGLSRDRFQLGGLGGYPFTGVTGLKAFASHIPDNGFAVIFYGPHIGISGDGTVGKVCRHHQDHPTSSCGALQMTVQQFLDPKVAASGTMEDSLDHQELEIISNLQDHQHEILTAKEPLLHATLLFYHVIDRRLQELFERAKDSFRGIRVAWIGGITINTDYGLPDWFEVKRFDIHTYG